MPPAYLVLSTCPLRPCIDPGHLPVHDSPSLDHHWMYCSVQFTSQSSLCLIPPCTASRSSTGPIVVVVVGARTVVEDTMPSLVVSPLPQPTRASTATPHTNTPETVRFISNTYQTNRTGTPHPPHRVSGSRAVNTELRPSTESVGQSVFVQPTDQLTHPGETAHPRTTHPQLTQPPMKDAMTENQTTEFMTLREVAEWIHIAPDTLRYWRTIDSGPRHSRSVSESCPDVARWRSGSRRKSQPLVDGGDA